MLASELEILRPKARKPRPRNRLAFCSPPASQKPLAYSGLGWGDSGSGGPGAGIPTSRGYERTARQCSGHWMRGTQHSGTPASQSWDRTGQGA